MAALQKQIFSGNEQIQGNKIPATEAGFKMHKAIL